jgi:hypothetical protein
MINSLFILVKGSVLICAGLYAGEVDFVYAGLVCLLVSPSFVIIETVVA